MWMRRSISFSGQQDGFPFWTYSASCNSEALWSAKRGSAVGQSPYSLLLSPSVDVHIVNDLEL
jgi:hypothetical protein